jgi:energy-coupling factor transporter ATP-binding protein EcfA2
LFQGPTSQWDKFVETENPDVDFSFRVFPADGLVGLTDWTLHYRNKKLALLKQDKESSVRMVYKFNGVLHGTQILKGKNRAGPDGNTYPIFRSDAFFSGFKTLKLVQSIDAHRVVTPELGLQSVTTLPSNAATLPQFLDTLSGNNRTTFNAIEKFVTTVFPEFEYVNPESSENKVFITLTLQGSRKNIRLTHCGTGVEQVLALATFVLTSPPGSIILLDEPHSYLHPSAERDVIAFLASHSEHRYLISTHSAVLINSVPPNRIIHLAPGETGARRKQETTEVSAMLQTLGYKNSDFLFNDRLIFVEGESDQEILPLLLERTGELKAGEIARTGFPPTDGAGRVRGKTRQTSILYYERMLTELGRANLPRIYLFDGDHSAEDRALLQGTKNLATGQQVQVRFLTRCELENYLLVPEAIVAAIAEQAQLQGLAAPKVTREDVARELQNLLESEGRKLDGKKLQPLEKVKGSALLERIFEDYGLPYRKRESGVLIARHITRENQTALGELAAIVKALF